LDDFQGYPALLVMFICNHCPFVIHLKKDIVKLANEYIPKGLAVVAISSNSTVTHPADGPDFMAEEAKRFEFPFPYLYDESQEIARAFGAACTPEFFIFEKDGRDPFELAYHGQFDDSRPNNNKPITGRDLRLALDCVLSGKPVSFPQRPSVGCSIKWHPGITI
jgi:thiol-disulfide isomerase/thioredoxin